MDRKKLLKFLELLVLFIFIVNLLANKFYWYYSVWYFDVIMHFLGGFWLGLVALYLWGVRDIRLIFKMLFFVFFLGLGWEVFEYLFNNYIAGNSFNVLDTASDIFFDLLGGLCAILYLLVPLKNKRIGSKE